jgi:hypothetical protein
MLLGGGKERTSKYGDGVVKRLCADVKHKQTDRQEPECKSRV